MLHLITGKSDLTNPEFKQQKVLCSDVNYTYTRENMKYAGIVIYNKDYLTNYENIDTLQADIEKQCRK